MGRWIRVEANLHTHPRIADAGFWGMTVIQAAWRICKAQDERGVVPAIFWTPTTLARWTLSASERGGLAGIKRGMESCEALGLVEREPDGSVRIRDWEQYQIDAREGNGKRNRVPRNNRRLRDPDPGRSRGIPERPETSRSVQQGSPPPDPPPIQDGTRTPDDIALRPIEDRIWLEWYRLYSDRWTVPPKADIDIEKDRRRGRSIARRLTEIAAASGTVLDDAGILEGWTWAASVALSVLERDKATLAYVESTIDKWITAEEEP